MQNKAILLGHVGQDPEIITTQSGSKLAKFSLATTEKWKDKNSGEKKEATEWHRIVVFSESLVDVVEKYIKKGSKLYVEGKISTTKWQDDNGNDRWSTDIQVRGRGNITMLDSKKSDNNNPPNDAYDGDDSNPY